MFLCNISLYSIRIYLYHHTHPQLFLFWLSFSFLLDLFLHSSFVAFRATTSQGNSSFSTISFCVFILYNWILNARWIARQLIFRRIQVFVVVQLLSLVWLFVIPWTEARQAFLSLTISGSFLKLMSVEWVKPSNHLILCCPRLFLSSIFPSIRVFSNESTLCIRWPKAWSFSPSNEYSGLISQELSLQHIQIIRTAQLKKKKTHQKN